MRLQIRTLAALAALTLLAAGPYKIVLADSGLPPCDELTDRIRTAHAASRPVAVHCVTREALVLKPRLDDPPRHRPALAPQPDWIAA